MYRFLVVPHIVDIGVKKCRLYKTSITLFVYYILTKKGGSKKVMHYYQLYKKFETKMVFLLQQLFNLLKNGSFVLVIFNPCTLVYAIVFHAKSRGFVLSS